MEVERLFEGSNNKKDYYIGLYIIKELILVLFSNERVRDVLVNLLQKLFQILEMMTQIIFSEISSQSRDLFNLEDNLQILEMICHILTISIQRIQNSKSDVMQVFLSNLQLLNFFEMVINFNFNQALHLQNEDPNISLITFDQFQQDMSLENLFNVINGIKYNSLKTLVFMNQYYLLKEQQIKNKMFDTAQIQQNYSYFLQKFESILLYICKQVHLCVNNHSSQYLSYIYVNQYIIVLLNHIRLKQFPINYIFRRLYFLSILIVISFSVQCKKQNDKYQKILKIIYFNQIEYEQRKYQTQLIELHKQKVLKQHLLIIRKFLVQTINRDLKQYMVNMNNLILMIFINIKQTQKDCIKNIDFGVVFIINSVNDSKLYKFFSQNYQDIFNEVLLSLVSNSSSDYVSYQSESEEFVGFEQDLYCSRESDVLKSNGCELLSKLSTSIDGFLAYTVTYCCKMIEYTCKQNKQQIDPAFKDLLQKYKNSLFLNLDQANQIETILLVLIILAPQVGLRRDLLKQIENTFKNYFNDYLIQTSGIARLRCSAIISHYSIYLFTEHDKQSNILVAINTKLLSDMMIFLIKSLKNQDEPKGISQAVDTLWRLIVSQELRGCIETVITDIIETLIQFINECKNEHFFEFLERVIHNYTFIIKNYATNMIQNLCQRVIKEQSKIIGKRYESSLIIMKCISCIIEFVKDEKIMSDFYIYFEEYILSIVKYLDIAEQIQFDDRLCELSICIFQVKLFQFKYFFFIYIQILKQLREFEEIVDIVGKNLDRLYEKNGKRLIGETYYELLIEVMKSQYLLYDKQYILCNVFRIALDSIKQLNINNLTNEYNEFIFSCFLIQLGIQYNHEIFNSKQKLYEDIVIYLIELYPTLTTQQFYPLKYIQIFLLFFYYQPVQTINAVKNSNIIIHLLQNLEITYIQKHLENAYDRKVLSYGLIGLISKWQDCQLNQDDVTRLFKLALYTLNYSQSNQNKSDQSKMVNEYKHKGSIEKSAQVSRPQLNNEEMWLQSNEDPDDLYDINVTDLEFEKLSNYYYRPERDFYPMIEKYNPPAFSCDEYSMYRKMLKKLKKEQGDTLSKILSQLNEEEKKLYNSIIKAQIVQTSQNQFQVRQIKKIKKRNQFYQQIDHQDMVDDEQTIQNQGDNIINEDI